jgi:3-hydroxyacyl-CoA dehydrogenase/enoyl-CoA hydratase/3-hydroxybutyryl-CoA epimerase
MNGPPELTQFRMEMRPQGVVHLIFDAPGRSMNVFSEAAIEDLGRFAAWLERSDVAGVVVRSGKAAFCAGADLSELGVAYDMIMAAPNALRSRVAFDHFFRLSLALRRLETAGKPVAAAVGGLALGGGCELALACHHRVMVDSPQAFLGLPESLVGLLPGAGGTQRLPRLVGVETALPVLLDGERLSAAEALANGLVQQVVASGEEVAAAEAWVRSNAHALQPWDRGDWTPAAPEAVSQVVAARRTRVLEETSGHYPAPLAILDCVERGLPQAMDAALRTEMEIFATLIQRPEPRNMIQTLFLGKQEHGRRAKAGDLPAALPMLREHVAGCLAATVRRAWANGASEDDIAGAMRDAGFTDRARTWAAASPHAPPLVADAPGLESAGLWFEGELQEPRQRLGQALLRAAAQAALPHLADIPAADRRVIDYGLVDELGFPAYLGGPLALAAYLVERAYEGGREAASLRRGECR